MPALPLAIAQVKSTGPLLANPIAVQTNGRRSSTNATFPISLPSPTAEPPDAASHHTALPTAITAHTLPTSHHALPAANQLSVDHFTLPTAASSQDATSVAVAPAHVSCDFMTCCWPSEDLRGWWIRFRALRPTCLTQSIDHHGKVSILCSGFVAVICFEFWIHLSIVGHSTCGWGVYWSPVGMSETRVTANPPKTFQCSTFTKNRFCCVHDIALTNCVVIFFAANTLGLKAVFKFFLCR